MSNSTNSNSELNNDQNDQNVQLKPEMGNVCVWPGVILGDQTPEDFEKWMHKEFGIEIQFLELIITKPDQGDYSGNTGGRSDCFFAIKSNDIPGFAIKRFAYGIRWLEDAVSNMNEYFKNPIYPERVLEYVGKIDEPELENSDDDNLYDIDEDEEN